MTDDELIEAASTSEAEAVKVAQEAWNGSVGRGNSLYRRMSELNTVKENPEVRKFILRFIEKAGLGGPNIDTLTNILDSNPRDDECPYLRAISSKYIESIAPALMLVSKGTPDQIVDEIAMRTGLAGQVYADKVKIKNKTLEMVRTALENGIKWENERGAIFLSKPISQESWDSFEEMFQKAQSVPLRFLVYIGREGSRGQREVLSKTKSPDIISKLMDLQFTGEWPVEPGHNKNELFLNWMSNEAVSIDEKIAKFDEVWGKLDQETKGNLVKVFAGLPYMKSFNKVVKMLENGETDEVEAITGNLSFSIANFSKILSAIERRGLLSRADPYFIDFVNKMHE